MIELTIKKVFRFENEKNGQHYTTYALSTKDHPEIQITGNWIYLKDTTGDLSSLTTGSRIKGEINGKTLEIVHDAYTPPPQPSPSIGIATDDTKQKINQALQRMKDELENIRLMMLGL